MAVSSKRKCPLRETKTIINPSLFKGYFCFCFISAYSGLTLAKLAVPFVLELRVKRQ